MLYDATAHLPLMAQDTAIVIHPESVGLHFTPPELPGAVVSEAVRFYNAPTTTRTSSPSENWWRGFGLTAPSTMPRRKSSMCGDFTSCGR